METNIKPPEPTFCYHIWSLQEKEAEAFGLQKPYSYFHNSYFSQIPVMLDTKIEIMDFLVFFFTHYLTYRTCRQSTYLHTNRHTHIVLWSRPAVSEDSASSRPLIGPISPFLVSVFVLMKAPAILSYTCFWKGWTYCRMHLSKIQ